MTSTKKQLLWTFFSTLAFYVIGRLLYEYFYRCTINLVIYFAHGKISFYGKFPFWFFGDPIFGLIICSIPASIFLCFKILFKKSNIAFKWTLCLYILFFLTIYLANCYSESFSLVESNDFYKTGQTLKYPISSLDLNSIFFETIIATTILTTILNTIKRYIIRRSK